MPLVRSVSFILESALISISIKWSFDLNFFSPWLPTFTAEILSCLLFALIPLASH